MERNVTDVIIGLYDQFMHPTMMQDAHEVYSATCYSDKLGIQGYYDTLIDHAQNMSVYPDAYTVEPLVIHTSDNP